MWVICGRNVALASFARREDALASLIEAGYSRAFGSNPFAPYSEYTNGVDTLSLVQLTNKLPLTTPIQLFRDQPAR